LANRAIGGHWSFEQKFEGARTTSNARCHSLPDIDMTTFGAKNFDASEHVSQFEQILSKEKLSLATIDSVGRELPNFENRMLGYR